MTDDQIHFETLVEQSMSELDVTDNDDLRELVAEWREAAENDAGKGYEQAAGTWAVAAKELEELIDE